MVHEKQLDIFQESLKLAREQGFIKQQMKDFVERVANGA